MATYLANRSIVAVGGSWMAPADWISAAQFDRIRGEVRKSVKAARLIKQEDQ
jgi:2-keto-3-deoxy-6-phosphogluconate aldolase